ncbi:MAG: signal recognition particle-docking protein FtsY, partial [Candidatus Nitrosotenuis sp.]
GCPQIPAERRNPEPKPDKITDPFEGIKDDDISKFADLYDVAPPENDEQAFLMASRIRKWISDGRPKPDEQKKKEHDETEQEKVKEDRKEKPKKKGFFGWMKK